PPSPAAASTVSQGSIPVMAGRSSPATPSSSLTPMKRTTDAGWSATHCVRRSLASVLRERKAWLAPASRKTAARRTAAIQSAMFIVGLLCCSCSALPLGERFAHDRLRLAEAFTLVEADRALVAGRDVELDDWLPKAIRPITGAGEQHLGKAVPTPCFFHVEGF